MYEAQGGRKQYISIRVSGNRRSLLPKMHEERRKHSKEERISQQPARSLS